MTTRACTFTTCSEEGAIIWRETYWACLHHAEQLEENYQRIAAGTILDVLDDEPGKTKEDLPDDD